MLLDSLNVQNKLRIQDDAIVTLCFDAERRVVLG